MILKQGITKTVQGYQIEPIVSTFPSITPLIFLPLLVGIIFFIVMYIIYKKVKDKNLIRC